MTRRDFEAIASALNGERPFPADFSDPDVYAVRLAVWARCFTALGDVCSASNGRFDRGRFERACGR